MNKGGYQILDLKNTSFALGTGAVVAGAFETIRGTKKPILVSGIVIAGKRYHDAYVDFTLVTTASASGANISFEGTMHGKKISITNKNMITISENA